MYMKHIKKFNEAVDKTPIFNTDDFKNPPIELGPITDIVKIPKTEFLEMCKFLEDNKKYVKWFVLSGFNDIKDSPLFKYYDTKEPNHLVSIPSNYMTEFENSKLSVEEAEFMEDCLIDLIDSKLSVEIYPFIKEIYIKFKSLSDIQLILDTLKQNKNRFNSKISENPNWGFKLEYELLDKTKYQQKFVDIKIPTQHISDEELDNF